MSDYLLRMREFADRFGLDSGVIRPCVALMLDKANWPSLGSDNGPERVSFLIAVELRRMGFGEDEVYKRLLKTKIVSPGKVKSNVKSAFKNDQRPWLCIGMKEGYLKYIKDLFCVGSDTCIHYERIVPKAKKDTNHLLKFREYGWNHIITPTENLIYLTVIEYEIIRGNNPGQAVVIPRDDMAYNVGASKRIITTGSQHLHELCLIEYIHGTRNSSSTFGSEYTRIIPVPKPPLKYRKSLESSESFNRNGRKIHG